MNDYPELKENKFTLGNRTQILYNFTEVLLFVPLEPMKSCL